MALGSHHPGMIADLISNLYHKGLDGSDILKLLPFICAACYMYKFVYFMFVHNECTSCVLKKKKIYL